MLGMGLPLLAKNTTSTQSTVTPSSKTGSKGIPAPVASSSAKAKSESPKKSVVVVTSDRSRANIAAAAAAQPQPAASKSVAKVDAPKPAPSAKNTDKPTLVAKTHRTRSNPQIVTPYMMGSVHGEPNHFGSGSDDSDRSNSGERLARVTAYWAAEGDYYTGRGMSSTGVRLHGGHCAVDPSIIPYGSVVDIAGVGKFLAVDTGSAVISRTAAREAGHTAAERHAIVVDVYFESRRDGEQFAAGAAKFVPITWWTPSNKAARDLYAEEDWTKIQGKQL